MQVDYSSMELNGDYDFTNPNFTQTLLPPGYYEAECVKATDVRKNDKGTFSRGVLLAPINALGKPDQKAALFYCFDFPVTAVPLNDGTETIQFLDAVEAKDKKLWKGAAYIKAALNGSLGGPVKIGQMYTDPKTKQPLTKEQVKAQFAEVGKKIAEQMKIRWKDNQVFQGEKVVIKVNHFTTSDGVPKCGIQKVLPFGHKPVDGEINRTFNLTPEEIKDLSVLEF